ncbi:MAG TPA: MFS transporter [Ktedonobacterales bacterium]|nr:MFS transporter [Ktedonobacterales bacterium]
MSASELDAASHPTPDAPSAIAITLATTPRLRRRWTAAYGLYTLASNLIFTHAVWVLYLAANGYSPFAIGLFETAFHLAKFLAELPTGIFADLWGRRTSLVVSCIVGAASSLLFLVPTAPMLVASFALSGVAYAFRGGADSALLWALAEESGSPAAERTAWYSRLFSRMLLVTIAAQTVGTGAGGFLGAISPAVPFVGSALTAAAGIPPLLLLPERRLGRAERPHPLAHLRAGLRAIIADPVLLGLLLLSGLTACVFTTVGYYAQLYFGALGFSLAAVGVLFAIVVVPDALGAALAPRLLHRLPRRALLALFVAMECVGLACLSAGTPVLAVVGYVVLLHSGDAVLYPALNTYLNERSPEAQRATVLSLETGIFSAAMIVLFPLFGLGLTHISYALAYRWTLVALVAGTVGIAALVAVGRRSVRQSTTLQNDVAG